MLEIKSQHLTWGGQYWNNFFSEKLILKKESILKTLLKNSDLFQWVMNYFEMGIANLPEVIVQIHSMMKVC